MSLLLPAGRVAAYSGAQQQQRHYRWNVQLGAPVTQKCSVAGRLLLVTVLHIYPECFAVVKRRRRKYRKMPLEERQEDRAHCPCDQRCAAVLEMHGEKQRCRQSGTISLKLDAQHHIKVSSRSMFILDRLRAASHQKFPMSTGRQAGLSELSSKPAWPPCGGEHDTDSTQHTVPSSTLVGLWLHTHFRCSCHSNHNVPNESDAVYSLKAYSTKYMTILYSIQQTLLSKATYKMYMLSH